MLEQYRVSDFVEWHANKSLVLNPGFQRGSVWKPAARIFLIDTILRDLPIPKIYMRSFIDRDTRKTKREVVDGQQRLRAIIDFANDRITLSSRAKEFSGFRFSNMPEDLKDAFLQYPIAVDQLVNASDQDVLDIFSRLNSYNVRLNPPELRHAEFQGDFKWSVHEKAVALFPFWEKYGVFSATNMVRMLNDSLVAEMYSIILDGVMDGGQPNITKRYREHDKSQDFGRTKTEDAFDAVFRLIQTEIADRIKGTIILQPAHLLMLFGALAHVLVGIPQGMLEKAPKRPKKLRDLNDMADQLLELASVIESEEEPEDRAEFWRASTSSTQRIASRRVRFPVYLGAVGE